MKIDDSLPEDFPPAEPSNLSRASVHSLAESIARQIDYLPGGDIHQKVNDLGGSIAVHDYWGDRAHNPESMIVYGEGNFKIFVPPDTSAERDRFTIAHELGHYVVHFLWRRHKGDMIENMIATRYGSDRVEWEANWFAAAFLMPESKFKKSWNKIKSSVLVANEFGVSGAAAKTRAKSLGLL